MGSVGWHFIKMGSMLAKTLSFVFQSGTQNEALKLCCNITLWLSGRESSQGYLKPSLLQTTPAPLHPSISVLP